MTILDKLADLSRERAKREQEKIPEAELREQAKALGKGYGEAFLSALKKPGISFICEIKKASPSKGIIAADFPFLHIAKEYEHAGADAISINDQRVVSLTDISNVNYQLLKEIENE